MSHSSLRLWKQLLPLDWKVIRRDSLLVWVPFFPFLLVLFLRLVIPPLTQQLKLHFGMELTAYYPLFLCGVLLLVPQMAGLVVGFLLLDERDERTLLAIRVSPVSSTGYLFYKLSLPLGLGILTTWVSLPFLGFVHLSPLQLLAVVPLCALFGPITALVLAAFADNKVAGLAVFKLLNGVLMLPIAAWFVPEPLQWCAGIIPAYWPMKAVWRMLQGQSAWWVLTVGWCANGLLLWGLKNKWKNSLNSL